MTSFTPSWQSDLRASAASRSESLSWTNQFGKPLSWYSTPISSGTYTTNTTNTTFVTPGDGNGRVVKTADGGWLWTITVPATSTNVQLCSVCHQSTYNGTFPHPWCAAMTPTQPIRIKLESEDVAKYWPTETRQVRIARRRLDRAVAAEKAATSARRRRIAIDRTQRAAAYLQDILGYAAAHD